MESLRPHHSIAIGTISGLAAHCKERRKKFGVLWFDARADFRKLDPRNVAIIGLRTLDEGERHNLKKAGMAVHLHVSFDLDCVDPVYAPGVGTPVKGGFHYREAHLSMEVVAESGRMTSIQVVEVNPILDERNKSAEFAVELIQSAFGKKIL